MFGRFPHRVRFAPAPYQQPRVVQLPLEMRTLPWILARSHAFPKQGRKRTFAAIAPGGLVSRGIPASTFFLPREAQRSYYADPFSAVQVVTQAQTHLTAIQRQAVQKHNVGMPLTHAEAREILAISTPVDPGYITMRRRLNVQAGGPPAGARQVPDYPLGRFAPAFISTVRGHTMAQQTDQPSSVSRPRLMRDQIMQQGFGQQAVVSMRPAVLEAQRRYRRRRGF